MSVRIQLFTATALYALLPNVAQAQTASNGELTGSTSAVGSSDEYQDQIVVSASRTATAVSEVAGSISVLSKERLEDQLSVSSDLNDVIGKAIPGLAANNELSFSGGTGPIVRGRPASVLVNGVPVNQLLRSSGFDLGLIDPAAIDRIEVNRGASAVFGFGASGGVINLITRRGRTVSPEVVVNVATSFNPRAIGDSLSARVYVGVGAETGTGIDYYIGGGYNRSRPTHDSRGRKNRSQDVHIFNLDTNIGFRVSDDSEIRITANFFRRNFNQEYLPPAYVYFSCADEDCNTAKLPSGLQYPNDFLTATAQPHAEVKDQFQQNIIMTGSYTDASFLGQALDVTLFYQKNTFFYVQTSGDGGDVPELSNFTSPMKDDRLGFRSSLTAQIPVGLENPIEITYGFDYINNSLIRTSEFGGSIQRPLLFNPGVAPLYNTGGPNRPLSPPVRLKGYAGFAQFKVKSGAIVLTGGVRHEEARPSAQRYVVANVFESGEDLIYNGGKMQPFSATLFNAGIVGSLATNSEIYAGLSQGVEISELGRAYRGLADIGSPGDPSLVDAQAAITTQYEIGFRHARGPINATGAVFYTYAPLSAQTIVNPDPACREPGALPCPVINLRQSEKIWGLEATLEVRASTEISFGGVFTYQNGEFRRDDDPNPEYQRLTTDRISPTRLTGYVEYRPTSTIKGKLQGTQSFRRNGAGGNVPLVPFGNYDALDTTVPGFFVLDALIEVQALGGALTLAGENILNKRYITPLIKVFNDLYDTTYAEGARITLGYKRTF